MEQLKQLLQGDHIFNVSQIEKQAGCDCLEPRPPQTQRNLR